MPARDNRHGPGMSLGFWRNWFVIMAKNQPPRTSGPRHDIARSPVSDRPCAGFAVAHAVCRLRQHQESTGSLEPLNRAVYLFNDGLDKAVMKPVATVYRSPAGFRAHRRYQLLQQPLRYSHRAEQPAAGKIADAASDVGRIAVNTTIGVAGLIDVATEIGLEKHEEDFGRRWVGGESAMGPTCRFRFWARVRSATPSARLST